MAPTLQIMIPKQDSRSKHPTPSPTPVRGTVSDTETIQDETHQRIEMVSPASATDAFVNQPSNSEQDTRGETTTQVSSLAVTEPEAGEKSNDNDIAGPSDKSNQEETTEDKSPKPSSLAPAAIHSDTAVQECIGESRPSAGFNDSAHTLLSHGKYRAMYFPDACHICDSCENIIFCIHGPLKALRRNNDKANEEEGQNEAVDEYPTGYGAADYEGSTVSRDQDCKAPWDAVPQSTKSGGNAAAPTATAEEPLYLRVKYDSRPFPDPSGSKNTGERGACCTIVSGIRPSDPFPVVMATILHRLKGTDGTHNPYPIAPTAQIDYVDIQFGAIAAHAPGFLGRRKIEEDNVGDLLNYLRHRQGGDDILEVFLVPMNEQDPLEHVPNESLVW